MPQLLREAYAGLILAERSRDDPKIALRPHFGPDLGSAGGMLTREIRDAVLRDKAG